MHSDILWKQRVDVISFDENNRSSAFSFIIGRENTDNYKFTESACPIQGSLRKDT
jgi:hypothetical protein